MAPKEGKRPKTTGGLTEKQENFCRYYLDTGNMSEAYRMAYDTSNMAPTTVQREAHRLVENHKITTRLSEMREERAKESKIKREEVEEILANIIRANPEDLYMEDPTTGKIKIKSPNQLPKRARNALKNLQNKKGEVKYEFHDKLQAIKQIASMNGWEAERKVAITNGDKPISELRIGFGDDDE